MCTTILVPGEASVVAEKLNSPNMHAYAESFGLDLADLIGFNGVFACSMSLSYSDKVKFGSTLARPALKWFLNVWMALSNRLRL